MLLRDCYFLPQSLDAGDCFVRLILLSHNTCLCLVLYLLLYCVCESNANKIRVPTRLNKNKIASLVIFFSILLILFSDGIKSHSLTRFGAVEGWYRPWPPLLCSSGCCFCAVLMQVYCSRLAAAEQRVCIHFCF